MFVCSRFTAMKRMTSAAITMPTIARPTDPPLDGLILGSWIDVGHDDLPGGAAVDGA